MRCHAPEAIAGLRVEFYWHDPSYGGGPPQEIIEPLWEPTLNNAQGFQAATANRIQGPHPFVFPENFTVPDPQFFRGSAIVALEPQVLYLVCGTLEGIHTRFVVYGCATAGAPSA